MIQHDDERNLMNEQDGCNCGAGKPPRIQASEIRRWIPLVSEDNPAELDKTQLTEIADALDELERVKAVHLRQQQQSDLIECYTKEGIRQRQRIADLEAQLAAVTAERSIALRKYESAETEAFRLNDENIALRAEVAEYRDECAVYVQFKAQAEALEARNRALVEALREADVELRDIYSKNGYSITDMQLYTIKALIARIKLILANDAKEKP